jgi:hypothetical protein
MLYNNGMKKKLYFMLAVGVLFITITVPRLVQAEVSTQDTTTHAATDSESIKRKGRIEEYKKVAKETVSNEMKIRIESRCIAAQGLVKVKLNNSTASVTGRTKAYNDVTSNLHALSTTLSAKGIDVTTLNADLIVLQTKITSLTVMNAAYQQALSDVAALDCKADPVAFKAALTAARSNQEALFKASKDIRTYITDTIKPVLKALKIAAEKAKE